MSESAASTEPRPANEPQDVHFDLSFLGDEHLTADYTLRSAGRSYPLERHTPESLAEAGLDRADAADGRAGDGAVPPTHVARAVRAAPAVVGLHRVLGPPDKNGFPTLAAMAVSTPGDGDHYTLDDVARAVVFLNPSVSVLTPSTADTVLGHIGTAANLLGLRLAIDTMGTHWNDPVPMVDDAGQPVRGPDGKQYFTYELAPMVANSAVPVSGQSKAAIYSDDTLQGTRWHLDPGVSHVDVSEPTRQDALAARDGRVSPTRALVAANASGYHVSLADGGPNYGLAVTVNGLSDDFVLDLTVTNSYLRHTSLFVSFLHGDGKTPMVVDDNIWTELIKGAMKPIVEAWLSLGIDPGFGQELLDLIESRDNTLKFAGLLGAESTFLGIPVSQAEKNLTFSLPRDGGPVGRIRLLVGSLGTPSGNEWDPMAAWLGIAMTSVIDLAIPTYALISTAGEESDTLFDSIFKNVPFLASLALEVYTIGKDIFTGDANTGADLKDALISLSSSLVTKVLTASDVAAQLALYFGAEEAEEAIPYVGWALKALAMEAAVEQLAQTIGEVISSPRVVEFDLTVTMNAVITLTPADVNGHPGEFPSTATTVAITAQFSDSTTRTWTGPVDVTNRSSLTIHWNDVPVGGTVTFVVAMFSAEGWGVGKGQSASMANEINDTKAGVLSVGVAVAQQLYPLSSETTYAHHQVLTYTGGAGYAWQESAQAPTETAESLGSGPSGHVLEALNAITLSDDLGILGYGWEASGLGIPPVDAEGTDTELDTELDTMQNIGFRPVSGDASSTWPQAGYMTAPAGYSKAPLLLYLRTASEGGPELAGPGLFFLDPSGDAKGGFHLRQVTAVTSADVPMDDPRRRFDLATGTSWGRFASLPTSLAIHTNGYVVGVNPSADNMQILRLAPAGTPDAQAPWACMPLGPGTGSGRLGAPALTCIRPDQTILVLEAGNRRIQAFSRGGHPVPAFPTTPTPYWIPLVSHAPEGIDVVHLSMSSDVAGYLYVLSQNGNGYDPSDFHLDIYAPTGTHLLHQQGLVAGGLAVDLWRNVYTLNFQQIAGPGGRTEPSLSEYLPHTPAARRGSQSEER
ncbi:hypothetical protein FHX52_4768 [Humibacillus xanthopallidus]|uniref:NHL repeat containing protein n=1 Tax=Humibacillus xanthopallidus TaxID=412689 RepID=A0A543PN69_9MICO|nr:hypothetical protein [Humibacillus xanthopallidus]TQN45528.1 hypothetical protein FHX52_4768 [Humibacillus xanthopallidus]